MRPSLQAPAALVQPNAERIRLLLVDGIRGIAALAVVLYHLNGAVVRFIPDWAPEIVRRFCELGWSGVQIFFVLSGFVITYSVAGARVTAGFVGRFALRRMLRLDPPYWGSIALALTLTLVANQLFPDLARPLPSLATIVAHLFYLQNILGYGDIVALYWTLCLEVQFYLLLVLLIYVSQRWSRSSAADWPTSRVFNLAFWPLVIASLAQYFDAMDLSPAGLFLPYWFFFSLGALVCLVARNKIASWFAWAAIVVVLVATGVRYLTGRFEFGPIAGAITATALLVASQRGTLATWMGQTVFQYLGRISYSLYLIHPIVGWSTVSVLERLAPKPLTWVTGVAFFVAGIVVSIISSDIFYRLIERPSHQFSRRVRVK